MAAEQNLPYAIRQFEVETWITLKLFGTDVSFTNSSSSMLVTVIAVSAFLYFATRNPQVIPGRLQAAGEWVYEFVVNTIVSTAGEAGRAHIPFVFTVFCFIFFGTVIGMTPVKFTFTSHIVVTFALALTAFVYVTSVGIKAQGAGFFRTFLPHGTPLWIAPLIIPIEAVSYLARPVTLGVRLFANVLAGHMIIKLFGDFAVMITNSMEGFSSVLIAVPILFMSLFYGVELIVVLIQSYIFILLICIYLRSSLEHH
jgi:F-type H+-transporting ATPase subunit a